MPLAELISKLKTNNLYVIQVEGSTDKAESEDLVFAGDIEEYILAVKSLKCDVIFMTRRLLDGSDFTYEMSESRFEIDEDSIIESIDLSTIEPSISNYLKYVGQECEYKFFAKTPNASLEFYFQEPWWIGFLEIATIAEEKIENDIKDKRLKQLSEQIASERELLERLRKLTDDNVFNKLPTQKAMLAYAIEKIPELEDMDLNDLRVEIQNLSAKLSIKGLGPRRRN